MSAGNNSIAHVWFSFQGRINRSTYWLFYFIPSLVLIVVSSILDPVLGTIHMTQSGFPIGLINSAVSLVLIWPWLAVGAKRCHDRDRSGWFQLIYLIPLFGALFMFIYIGFLKGTDGPNRFGPDPLGGSATDFATDGMAHGDI
jgi:uncharacterized membrane protein YhaH (DUF805 family)